LAKGKTSEELQLDAIKRQRQAKMEQKQKVKSYYAKINGKTSVCASRKASVIKQEVTHPEQFKLSSS